CVASGAWEPASATCAPWTSWTWATAWSWPGTIRRRGLRNRIRCASLSAMAVATATKIRALKRDFRSGSAIADLLGVNGARITRGRRGAGMDPLNAEKIDLLELVWSNLRRLYEADAARAWLFGLNPHLGDRRPIDVIRTGRVEELMRAIRAERADAYA